MYQLKHIKYEYNFSLRNNLTEYNNLPERGYIFVKRIRSEYTLLLLHEKL